MTTSEPPGASEPPEADRMDDFLGRLEGVRAGGGGWAALCPGHEDGSPSLSVREGERGVVFHCHAGCPPGQVLAAIGLTWANLFWKGVEPDAKPRRFDRRATELEAMMCAIRLMNEPQVLARLRNDRAWARGALEKLEVGWDGRRLTLPVRDKDGKLHDVLRYDPWGGQRKMLAGAGRSRMPWPSPERLDGNTLFVVEGEGTALSLASIGLVAVALPGAIARQSGDVMRPGKFEGVGWHPSWARRLSRFGFVVCLPDCDDVGRLLMRTVEYDLRSLGTAAVVVDIGREGGYDIGDWLKVARTGELRRQAQVFLKALVRTTREQMQNVPDMVAIMRAWEASLSPVRPVAVAAKTGMDWS